LSTFIDSVVILSSQLSGIHPFCDTDGRPGGKQRKPTSTFIQIYPGIIEIIPVMDGAVQNKETYQNVKFLFNQGAATVAELDLARERKTKAELDHYRAWFELGKLQKSRQRYPKLPEIETVKKRRQIHAKVKALELKQTRLSQTLPYGGRVLDVFAKEGESVSTGSSLLLLGRSDKPLVIAYLPPKYSKYARKGQKAVVKLPNGETLQAKVNTDSNLTKRLPADLSSPIGSRDLMLLVSLALESPLPDFHWVDGLPVTVRFQAKIL
jgi:hypothetical protein